MTEMSRDERREFLLAGTRTAKVATVRREDQVLRQPAAIQQRLLDALLRNPR
jgi:hypothetical protein